MLKVTVNLSPAFGAHRLYQSAGHRWITVYITRFAVVGPLWILFPFSIPQSRIFLFSRRLDNAANLHNTTFA